MKLSDLLTPDAVLPSLHAQSKKQVLQEVCASRRAPDASFGARDLRHAAAARAPRLDRRRAGRRNSARQAARARPDRRRLCAARRGPVDFDSLDDQPVDLVFVLLAPESAGADHLKALARIARILRDPGMAQKLRTAQDAERHLLGADRPRRGVSRRLTPKRQRGPKAPLEFDRTRPVTRATHASAR